MADTMKATASVVAGLAAVQELASNGVRAEAAQERTPAWGDPSKHRILGKRFPRTEGPEKVTGRAKYTYDVVLPGMLYGRIFRAPYPGIRIDRPEDVGLDELKQKMPDTVKATINVVGDGGMRATWAGQEL